jgi:hypothetical protein
MSRHQDVDGMVSRKIEFYEIKIQPDDPLMIVVVSGRTPKVWRPLI